MDCLERIIRISNTYYNIGLERAGMRDLSGSAEYLQKSLKYNKVNMQARNLLGLVYFEMGETVDAISQWVISRSLMPENNPAEEYLNKVGGNRLEAMNQTIRKYNQALQYCRQGSYDLATIQLKKVLNQNPRLLKGHQLLALLYMQAGKYSLAEKTLKTAGQIDVNNFNTLRYLREVHQYQEDVPAPSKKKQKKKNKKKEELVSYQSGNETIIHPANFKDNSALGTILNIVVGVVIGALITAFLLVPNVKREAVNDANRAVREANEVVSSRNQTIQSLEGQIESMKSQVEKAEEAQSDSAETIKTYEKLLEAYEVYVAGNVDDAGNAIASIDSDTLSEKGKTIYQTISDEVTSRNLEALFTEAQTAYNKGNYEEAEEKYLQIVETKEDYKEYEALFNLAQTYRRAQKNEDAIKYYKRYVELNPGTSKANQAENYVKQLEQTQ